MMEMPTPCERCNRTFDLHDGLSSPRDPRIVICAKCANKEEKEIEREEEIDELKEQVNEAEYAIKMARERLTALGVQGADIAAPSPIDVLLFCPNCLWQHVDAPAPDVCEACGRSQRDCQCKQFTPWLNRPHKKHRCHCCNQVWKPCALPTNGVAALPEAATQAKGGAE